jgi:DNA-directed RNA polymerase subunit RPC12/RpoP
MVKGIFNEMRRGMRMGRRKRWAGGLQTLIWLLGLAYLAVTGRWWPGILVLVAISVILGMIFGETAGEKVEREPEEMEQVRPVESDGAPEIAPEPPLKVKPMASDSEFHHAEWLPLTCPRCGAPTRAADVKWTGDAIATCPYCGSNLPLKKT